MMNEMDGQIHASSFKNFEEGQGRVIVSAIKCQEQVLMYRL